MRAFAGSRRLSARETRSGRDNYQFKPQRAPMSMAVGPVENRGRFMLEVTDAADSVWGADRVGVRIAPSSSYGSMFDSNSPATFG